MRTIWTDARRGHQATAAPATTAAIDGNPTNGINQAAGQSQTRNSRDGLTAWRSLGVAAAAGLALAGAFPPVGIWPLAVAGPALLTLAAWAKRPLPAFGLGLACGVVFFVGLLSWLVNVAWYAWAALVGVQTLVFAVLAVALPPLLRLRAWPLAVAGWWVAQESVRDRFPWGGFPWGRLAMSQASAPTAGWAAIGGPPLLTFLLALAGACVAYLTLAALGIVQPAAWRRSHTGRSHTGRSHTGRSHTGRSHTVIAGLLTVLALGAVLAGNLAWRWTPGPGRSAVVATIQGNVPHSRTLPDQLRATTVTSNHSAATFALAAAVRAGRAAEPDVVIWPENSTDIDPSRSPSTYETIELAVDAIDRPVLVGAVLAHPVRNAGQLWLPDRGPTQLYVKRKLVPFGEVIPYRGFLELFTSLPSLQPHNFTPGHRAVVFKIGKVRLGDVICYEVGFDNLLRSEVLAGANLLAVQTNDADFELDGQQGETLQQLEMARMDAITTGRAVAVASTIGVSAIIAPDGTVLTHSRPWTRAELEARVPLISALTPADRVGSWPELVIVVLTGLALLWALAGLIRGSSRRDRRLRAGATAGYEPARPPVTSRRDRRLRGTVI